MVPPLVPGTPAPVMLAAVAGGWASGAPLLGLAVGAGVAWLAFRRRQRDREAAATARQQGAVLARWSFPDEVWRVWVDGEVARARRDRWKAVVACAVMGGLAGAAWGWSVEPAWAAAAAAGGACILGLLAGLAAGGQTERLAALRHARPEVVVTDGSVEIGGEAILWYRKVPWSGGYRLRWARFEAAPRPRLLIALAYRGGGTRGGLFDRPTLHLPVPADCEGEAARLAYRLSHPVSA